MRVRTQLAVLAVAAMTALAVGSCKKKGKEQAKDDEKKSDMAAMTEDVKAPMGGMDVAEPGPGPAKKKSLFDPVVFKIAMKLPASKDPVFAKIQGEIPKVAEACKKSKKYVSSFSWCAEWKTLQGEIKKVINAIDKNKPETVKAAMAVALAAASKLRDPELFVRYTGLQIMEEIFYNFSYKGLKKPRALLARIVAHSVKDGTDYNERNQAIRVIGNDGGLSHFNGGVYDGKVLAWAAHKDKSHWVRRSALVHLASCMDRLKSECPVTQSKLRSWYAAEKDNDAQEGIARLAGKLKMTVDVFAWCSPKLLESKLYWGCRDAFKFVLDKDGFDKFHDLAKKFRDSDKSKDAGNFRLAFVVQLMFHGLGQGFPRDKVVGYIDSLLAQEETATKRAKSVFADSLAGLVKISNTKAEIKALQKLLKKRGKKFSKLLKKDKARKDWAKVWKDTDKELKQKAKAAK